MRIDHSVSGLHNELFAVKNQSRRNFMHGPQTRLAQEQHARKYRGPGETFYDYACRVAGALSENEGHRTRLKNILLSQAYLPAGRSQRAVGAPQIITPYNCFVSGTIEDDSSCIFDRVKESFLTMRVGGGIGFSFSKLRYKGAPIVSLGSDASGPISFMEIFDSTCKTVMSAGSRRGAMMAVLRCDHPDIEMFIGSKQDIDPETRQSRILSNFNISVSCTDAFMHAVKFDLDFELVFNGRVINRVKARLLWEKIMRSTWDYAEPGVLFIDTINRMNNLRYCEDIEATNPCGEQPLPPYGACLLGSMNLVKYVESTPDGRVFDYDRFSRDVIDVVRATDRIIDTAIYPLPEQRTEALNKRRMGIGVTGTANAIEALGFPFGSEEYISVQSQILEELRNSAYTASIMMAKEKGRFPLFDREYLNSGFAQTLPEYLRKGITDWGIRNSHLTSIAPTGTISLCADNVSSGIEPVFSKAYERTYRDGHTSRVETILDYGWATYQTEPVTASMASADDHVNVLVAAQRFVDSACSKTCNVGDNVSWHEFKELYMKAYRGGAKGCTTFRPGGKIYGILNEVNPETQGAACFIDEKTGNKSCSD